MPLPAGHTLAFYEILGSLGAGAMGEVYRARDTRLEREVAIKVLPAQFAEDSDRLKRFEREAKSLATLNHPCVAQVFGLDQADDVSFIAMELVPGEDLDALLKRGPLPLEEAVDICRQIAEGLEAAHDAGVVHRDLKPANVVVTPEGKVKVLDFGLAKPVGPESAANPTDDSWVGTESGCMIGTPAYMAPEQVRGKPIDKRVDVWAFGCVLFTCLSGERPFRGMTMSDVLASVLEREPDYHALPNSLPSELRELIERCLRKDPRRRLRDLGEARIALEDLAEAGFQSQSPLLRRSPLVPVLAAISAVASLTALWLWSERTSDSSASVRVLRQITTDPAWESNPNWSESGEFIAFTRATENGLDIYVVPSSTDGTAEVRAAGKGDEVAPRFSPNNQWIAFISSSEIGSPLCLVKPHGADDQVLSKVKTGISVLDLNTMYSALGDRPWSSDSKTILVSIASGNSRMAINRLDIDTSASTPLTHPDPGEEDLSASLSPDGQRIVFQRRSHGGSSLWIIPAGGGREKLLLSGPYLTKCPIWHSDGVSVFFIRSDTDGSEDLYVINTKTGLQSLLYNETRRLWTHSISRDDRIAVSPFSHKTHLYSVARAGDDALERLNAYARDNFGAHPSPVDSRIIYHSTRMGGSDLYLHEEGRPADRRLTMGSATDLHADWAPDGKRVVFCSSTEGPGGPFNVYVMDMESGTRTRIVDQPLSVYGSNNANATILAKWSPDKDEAEQRIAYITTGGEGSVLWTVDTKGNNPRRELTNVFGFDWYLDHRRCLVIRMGDNRTPELYAYNLETQELSAPLYREPHTEIEVAHDGTAVSFSSGPGHLLMNLFVLELGPPDPVTGLPSAVGKANQRTHGAGEWHVHNGGWMANSQTLVFTRDEDEGNIYELVLKD